MKSHALLTSFVLLIIAACQQTSPETKEEVVEIPVLEDSVVDRRLENAIKTEPVQSAALPEKIKTEKKEITETKIRTSIFLADGCCKDATEAVACCCDEVLKHYARLLNEEKWEDASKARGEDIILNDCRKNYKGFQEKLYEIEFNEE